MMQLCQQVLNGKEIPDERKTSVVWDVMSCGSY